jgi:predicted Zn-dependent peptidase
LVQETLPGGLRVVLEHIPYVRSVSVGVWVGVGSRHEPCESAGISHLVEHLLFKGTERRSARQIAEEMDVIGGLLNGYTSKEYTCYYVKVLDEHLEKAVDLLSDLVLSPRFDPADLAKEKGVILEELKMYEDTPDELAGDLLAEAAWGGDPLGRAILGEEATIDGMSSETVTGHHRSTYRQGATVVALAGNVTDEEGLGLVRRYFSAMTGEGGRERPPAPSFGPGCRLKTKKVEQAHVCVGYEAVPLSDPALFDSHLLAGILGGGSSSRLFQSIREERGLAYSVYSYAAPYSDTGLFGVYAGVSPDNVLEVLRLIAAEIRDIRENGPDPEELGRAKEQVKSSILLGLENTSNRMSRLGKSLLLMGRTISPDELARRIEAVTLESVTGLARRMLDPRRVALAAVGPEALPGEDDLRQALERGDSG